MSEVSEELKNKIRRERIIEIIYNQKNKLTYNRNTFYNARPKTDAYYKSPTQFTLKDVNEEDIIDLKNKKIKKDCIDFLIDISPNIVRSDSNIEAFNEMDIDDVLLITYRNFLEYQITRITPSLYGDMSIDKVEELLDGLISKKEKANKDDELKRIMERCKEPNDKETKKYKSRWNLF